VEVVSVATPLTETVVPGTKSSSGVGDEICTHGFAAGAFALAGKQGFVTARTSSVEASISSEEVTTVTKPATTARRTTPAF
jgi:hypothetical protein